MGKCTDTFKHGMHAHQATIGVNSVDDIAWQGFMTQIKAQFGDLYQGWGGIALAFTAV